MQISIKLEPPHTKTEGKKCSYGGPYDGRQSSPREGAGRRSRSSQRHRVSKHSSNFYKKSKTMRRIMQLQRLRGHPVLHGCKRVCFQSTTLKVRARSFPEGIRLEAYAIAISAHRSPKCRLKTGLICNPPRNLDDSFIFLRFLR